MLTTEMLVLKAIGIYLIIVTKMLILSVEFFFLFYGNRSELSGLYSFLGIRFAEQPIGQFRFRRPQYRRMDGDLNATVYGQPCPQPDSAGYIVGSEDCLWLNVYTPRMPDESTGLPVIVWIHGGGYRYGSANQYTVISFFFVENEHSPINFPNSFKCIVCAFFVGRLG